MAPDTRLLLSGLIIRALRAESHRTGWFSLSCAESRQDSVEYRVGWAESALWGQMGA